MKKVRAEIRKSVYGNSSVLLLAGPNFGQRKFLLDSEKIVSEFDGNVMWDLDLEYDSYIHYSEYDFNCERPTLVVRGDFLTAGYDIDHQTGGIKSCCICAAHSDSECCCLYQEGFVID